MGRTRPAIDGGEHLREDAVPGRRVVDPGHPRDVRVHGSEGDEDSQECDDCPAVGTEGVRHHRGKGGGPAPDHVCAGADRDDRNGEVEAADQEDADDHAAVEISVFLISGLYLAIAVVTVGTGAYMVGGGATPFAAMMSDAFGSYGGAIVALLAVFVTFGTVNAYVAGMARVYYAAARDG